MGATKSPSRQIDGPFAAWDASDETAQIALANGSTLKLGQPLCIDVTSLGPDQNVPNNAASLPLCERLVATTSANAGPIFGVVSGVANPPAKVALTTVNGVPTWTNSTGASVTLTITVRQNGFGYVYCGTTAIGQTGGNSILVGSSVVTTTAQTFGIKGTAGIATSIGTAIATAINTNQGTGSIQGITAAGAAASAGVISVIPNSLVGIVPNAMILIDSLASGVQEAVSVGSISYPTVSIAITNAHTGGFKITGPNTNPAINSVLISTPGSGVKIDGLVACWINILA